MFATLGVKTDFSLLKSLIKVEDYVSYALNNKLTCIGILDDNLSCSHLFYTLCKKNNIKPIIGLDIFIEDVNLYLYPKNYNGLLNLFKVTSLDNISLESIKEYSKDIICVLNYENVNIFERMNEIFEDVFLSYKNEHEYMNLKLISNNLVYINPTLCLDNKISKYINYLELIKNNKKLGTISLKDYSTSVIEIKNIDTTNFTNLINIEYPDPVKHIPVFMENSFEYLKNLTIKGLSKRLDNDVPEVYKERLLYELDVINKMGFTDYFLIVFDYVRFAKKSGILIGAGRGSAAGSLVSYSLGITEIDPIKYNLLFERFLNPERVTMPDIDIDFEYTRVNEVFNYVKEKYGEKRVSRIITYGTFQAREAIRTIGNINDVNEKSIASLLNHIDSKKSLRENLNNEVKDILKRNSVLKKVYEEALIIEGVKKNTSIHAAGVVISSIDLNNIIPVYKKEDFLIAGYTMNELESLGLLKMDFLALRNLTVILNIINSIDKKIDINKLPLDDEKVYKLFSNASTVGIFQFESFGIKSFLKKYQPKTFSDLVLTIAFYRPGPMQNIDLLLSRKNKNTRYDIINEDVNNILKDTYGIIVYQEQIMEILKVMASYSYAKADIVRRAISKKKLDDILSEENDFILSSIKNGYSEKTAKLVFDSIVKFASFGFNKSHSVAYAMIAYQMAYLKVHYPYEFYVSLLNTNIGGEVKLKEYISEAKENGIVILKPDINLSTKEYKLEKDGIRLPLRCIKGLGIQSIDLILSERENGEFKSIYDFMSRCYGKNINKKILETLIYSGVFDNFSYNRNTLINNMNSMITYAELTHEIDSSLVSEPEMKIYDELDDVTLMNKEISLFGFYLSMHPASKYPNVFKQINIKSYFDKVIDTVVLVDKITKLKTKNNDDMAFLLGSDETASSEFVLFKTVFNKLDNIKVGDMVKIRGRVEKRLDKYQIVVSNIDKL